MEIGALCFLPACTAARGVIYILVIGVRRQGATFKPICRLDKVNGIVSAGTMPCRRSNQGKRDPGGGCENNR